MMCAYNQIILTSAVLLLTACNNKSALTCDSSDFGKLQLEKYLLQKRKIHKQYSDF